MSSDNPACREVAERLAARAHGTPALDTATTIHIASCLRCQAEQARYRRLMRAMRDMASTPVPVDPTLEHQILFAVDAGTKRSRTGLTGRLAATLGGLAAGAAAAAGVIVITARQRRVARLAS